MHQDKKQTLAAPKNILLHQILHVLSAYLCKDVMCYLQRIQKLGKKQRRLKTKRSIWDNTNHVKITQ